MTTGGPGMTVRVLEPGQGGNFPLSAGDEASFKVTGEHTQGRFTFLEFVSQPGHPGGPMHVHTAHEELWYVVEGELMLKIGEQVYRAAPRSTHFVPRDVPHGFWNAGDQPCRFVAVFCPAGLEGHMEERSRLVAEGKATSEVLQALAAKYDMRLVGPPPGAAPQSPGA